MAGSAKIHINLREGTFEVEGSEEFVKAQLKAYDEEIRTSLAQASTAPPPPPPPGNGEGGDSSVGSGERQPQLQELADVLDVTDGKTHILGRVQGPSKREKMRRVALLYLYGAELSGRKEMVPLSEIREACSDQGCLDHNFIAALRDGRENFRLDGETVKLTAPGRKAAHDLAVGMKSSG